MEDSQPDPGLTTSTLDVTVVSTASDWPDNVIFDCTWPNASLPDISNSQKESLSLQLTPSVLSLRPEEISHLVSLRNRLFPLPWEPNAMSLSALH
jgi:hypothetical protein